MRPAFSFPAEAGEAPACSRLWDRGFNEPIGQGTSMRFVCHSQTQECSELDTGLKLAPGVFSLMETRKRLSGLSSKSLEPNNSSFRARRPWSTASQYTSLSRSRAKSSGRTSMTSLASCQTFVADAKTFARSEYQLAVPLTLPEFIQRIFDGWNATENACVRVTSSHEALRVP
jgi:hypothetical protein